jgi:PPOX class probable F420-dependent enzyme
VQIERATEFLRGHHRAVLATTRSDGRPQLSPVIAAVDDDGRVLISTRESAVKTKNLARDPHASLCVMSDTFFGDWIQVDGTAEIVHLPDALDLLVDYYRRISGEHPDWADYRGAMQRDRRVIARLTIVRAGPARSGGGHPEARGGEGWRQ